MSGWEAKLFRPSEPRLSLPGQVQALLEQQRATWDAFREGEARLDGMRVKALSMDGSRVLVQANPGRVRSTDARVDSQSVAARPCFLCPESLAPAERGVSFGDYVILPNPYPIWKQHLTIPHREHVPQFLEGRIDDFLALVKALGPGMLVIYNGPRCGASAPDHLHFQACASAGIPIVERLVADGGGERTVPHLSGGRRMLVCGAGSAGQARRRVSSVMSALRRIAAGESEPMINVVGLYRDGRYAIGIFPRAKHRSACYFDEPGRQVAVSPAAMEMAGIVVVANVEHFDRIDEAVVRAIFEEVTLGPDLFSRLTEAVA